MLKKIKPIYYLVSIFFLCLIYAFTGKDTLPLEYMNTFDMKNYVELTQKFPRYLYYQDFTPYYISRLLVPGFTYYLFRLFRIDLNIYNIHSAFIIFNFISIIISICYYLKIAEIKEYSQKTTMLGFSFLFVNFFILKLSNYYPILMDVFGFTSGVLLYYFYLSENKLKFYLLLMISMFVFPTTILIALALIGSNFIIFNDKGIRTTRNINLFRYTLMIISIIILICFCVNLHNTVVYKMANNISLQLSENLFPVTLLLLCGFLFIIYKQLLYLVDGLSINLKKSLSYKLLFPVLIIVLYFLISRYLTVNFKLENTLSSQQFFFNILFQAISFPLKFFITHFIYYGVFIVFVSLFYKEFFTYAKNNSDSFFKILIILFVLLSLGTETRQFLQIFPFIVFVLLDSLKKYNFSKISIFTIFAFQLVWSRFWYTINSPESFLKDAIAKKDFLDFPAQRYFQFQGPWLSTYNSFIYGGILILVFFLVYKLIKPAPNKL